MGTTTKAQTEALKEAYRYWVPGMQEMESFESFVDWAHTEEAQNLSLVILDCFHSDTLLVAPDTSLNEMLDSALRRYTNKGK